MPRPLSVINQSYAYVRGLVSVPEQSGYVDEDVFVIMSGRVVD